VFDWFWKRVFTTKRVGFLIEKAMPNIEIHIKEMAHNLLSDEELAKHLTLYGDALYNRYSKMFWGTIGGRQKGLNSAVEGEIQNLNPLTHIFDDDGNISLSGIIKGFLRGEFKGLGSGGGSPLQPQALSGQRSTPNMQRI